MNKWGIRALVGCFAVVFALVSCEQPAGGNIEDTETARKIAANKAIYEEFLLGVWKQAYAYQPASQPTQYEALPDGYTIKFEDDSFTLWDEYFSGQDGYLTCSPIDFSIIFDDPETGDYDISYWSSDSSYTGGYITLRPDNDDPDIYAEYGITVVSRNVLEIYQYSIKTKNGDLASVRGAYHYFVRSTENPPDDPPNNGEDVEIAGSYDIKSGIYTHTLTFNNDGTYNFFNSVSPSSNRNGTWSINGDNLTMSYSTGGSGDEEFTVSLNENSYTLAFTGNAPSLVFLELANSIEDTLTITRK